MTSFRRLLRIVSPKLKRGMALAVLALSLAGCSPFVDQSVAAPSAPVLFPLEPGQTLGQTLVAHHDGLTGIDIYLQPQTPGSNEQGAIRLHVRANPQSPQDVAASTLAANTVTGPGFYRFNFAPLADSRQADFYLLLESTGAAQVQVGSASGDSYLDGALYRNGDPVDAQMAFRLAYAWPEMAVGFARQLVTWVLLLTAGVFLYILPGWALLSLLWRRTRLSWAEKLGLAAGLSVALYPLFMAWTSLATLQLGPLYAWLPGLLALGVLVARHRTWRPVQALGSLREWRSSAALWPDLALLGVLAIVIAVRFLAIGTLDVPLWGDSYQHTMIAQLIVDNGGLFNSWQPYAELQTLTYHAGFHINASVFAWLTSLDVPQAVLWTGQIFNCLAVVCLYPLAMRIGHNRWAGVATVLVAGLASSMPMFYVNWGRYTQLAGQVILPVAMLLAWTALAERKDWRLWVLNWVAWGGLAITHYRVLLFAVIFFIALLIVVTNRTTLRTVLVNAFSLGAGAVVLCLPWFIHLFGSRILLGFAIRLSTPAEATPASTSAYNAMGDLSAYLPTALWVLLLLCMAWGLWRREKGIALLTLWGSLLLLATNPQWLRLPGEGALSNFAVLTAAYIPAALIVGSAAGWLATAMAGDTRRRQTLVSIGLAMAAMLASILAISQRLGDVQIEPHALVTRPDIRAAAWIKQNSPADARFLVNAFFAFGNTSIVGSDGGWWLPLLAHRQTTLPPLTYSAEVGPRPDYQQWINLLSAAIWTQGIDDPAVLALLKERGVTHVYIGQQQGRTNYTGPEALQPAQLLADPHFRVIYHQDRVWVFEIVQ